MGWKAWKGAKFGFKKTWKSVKKGLEKSWKGAENEKKGI